MDSIIIPSIIRGNESGRDPAIRIKRIPLGGGPGISNIYSDKAASAVFPASPEFLYQNGTLIRTKTKIRVEIIIPNMNIV